MKERTLSIIKPNAMKKNVTGNIISRFEKNDLAVIAAQIKTLTPDEAKTFYLEHKDRPFYGELVEFMCSGPVMLMVLEGEGAIDKNREIMGATNPAEAAPGTIRKDFGDSLGENAVHGSDAPKSAVREVKFFFDL
jgi:nucleoside-diphosphate kinase